MYSCDACGDESDYHPDMEWNAPTFYRQGEDGEYLTVIYEPVCPVCFEKFVRASCGIMRPK